MSKGNDKVSQLFTYLLINWKPGNIRRTWYLPCDWCIPNYFSSRFDYNLCFIHVSVCKTCFQCPIHTKNWPNWRNDTANDVVYVALVSLLLTLNRFHTLLCCLYCLIWTSKNAGWVVFATRNNLSNSKQIEQKLRILSLTSSNTSWNRSRIVTVFK